MAHVDTVLAEMWDVLNTSTILNRLDGRLYKGFVPRLDEKAARKNFLQYDTSPMTRERTPVVNNGFINVNHYTPDVENGQPDFAKDTLLADALETVIKAHNSGSTYFALDIITDDIYQAPIKGWSYHNFVIEFSIQD